MLFDNGNGHSPPLTRVVEYEIDEVGMIASLVWEYRNPYGDVSLSMGSSQRLPNGNTLINWGNVGGEGAHIAEVDYLGNKLLEIKYHDGTAYKVRKSDWSFDIPMDIGDCNLDGGLDVLDVIYQINYIISGNEHHSLFDLYKIDINKDSYIDILDVISLVSIVLS